VQVKIVLERAADNFGRVDGKCDCAGSQLIKPAHLTSAEEFHDAIAHNILTAFNILKASVRCSLKLRCSLCCIGEDQVLQRGGHWSYAWSFRFASVLLHAPSE
jgi:NAD(P)-dependent dehydrogenase (short-subunit alcohol dehydrogenase family)